MHTVHAYNCLPTSPTDQYHHYHYYYHPIGHSGQSFRSLALLTSHTYYIYYALFLPFPHSSAADSYSYTSCRCDIAIRGHTQFGLVSTCLNLFTVALDSACHSYLAVILDLQSITSDARHRGFGCQDRYSVLRTDCDPKIPSYCTRYTAVVAHSVLPSRPTARIHRLNLKPQPTTSSLST